MTMMTSLNQITGKQWSKDFSPKPTVLSPTLPAQPNRHWLSANQAIQLNHISRITYAIPIERVRPFVPANFGLPTKNIGDNECALLTVESFLDQGGQAFTSITDQTRLETFEQTNYRIHAQMNGQPCGWLIGSSLGSLSAVASRHLWPAPWHLSAMELQIAYDAINERYRHYRLRTQSQWANADWELSDSGQPAINDFALLSELAMPDYFIRRDGSLGLHKVSHEAALTTHAELRSARCDLLEKLGLLRAQELMRPLAVTLQRRVTCRIDVKAKAFLAAVA